MTENKFPDPKERILTAALDLLGEGKDPESISMREIASRANVGLGLINYHFQSKENLFYQAVGQLLVQVADQWKFQASLDDESPTARLRTLLKETSQISVRNPRITRILVSHELTHNSLGVAQYLLPYMRVILGHQRGETAARAAAFSLMSAIQVAFANPDAVRTYFGIEIENDHQREELLDTLIDQFIPIGG
jgi:AcrR family transcriptional regulator